MAKYNYIGKMEILHRVRSLGYVVRSARDCSYKKFEGVEWLECADLKVTVQRSGDWLQVTKTEYNAITEEPEKITRTFCNYSASEYLERY